jgi:hypothetical protein
MTPYCSLSSGKQLSMEREDKIKSRTLKNAIKFSALLSVFVLQSGVKSACAQGGAGLLANFGLSVGKCGLTMCLTV